MFVKNVRCGPRWLPGIVTEALQRAYLVQVGHNVLKRDEKQLLPRFGPRRDSTTEEIALPVSIESHGFSGSKSITPHNEASVTPPTAEVDESSSNNDDHVTSEDVQR